MLMYALAASCEDVRAGAGNPPLVLLNELLAKQNSAVRYDIAELENKL